MNIHLFPPKFRQHFETLLYINCMQLFSIKTHLYFIFQVAEALLNPLGEDDDDFECNWLIDRNMSTGIEIVDTCHDSCPPLKLDEPDDESGTMYWCQLVLFLDFFRVHLL